MAPHLKSYKELLSCFHCKPLQYEWTKVNMSMNIVQCQRTALTTLNTHTTLGFHLEKKIRLYYGWPVSKGSCWLVNVLLVLTTLLYQLICFAEWHEMEEHFENVVLKWTSLLFSSHVHCTFWAENTSIKDSALLPIFLASLAWICGVCSHNPLSNSNINNEFESPE